jgi:hypothetical protein
MSHKGIALDLDRKERARPALKVSPLGIALAALAILAIVSMLFFSGPTAATTGESGGDADAARWTAMGEHYNANALAAERSQAASAARWEAAGQHYQAEEFDVERSMAVNAARYAALGLHYSGLRQDLTDIQAARYQAMGEWYSR